MEIVEVTWLDAWSDEAHLQKEALTNLAPITRQSVGFLMENDEDKIVLSSGLIHNLFAEKTFVDGFMVIPWGMVTLMRKIEDNQPT